MNDPTCEYADRLELAIRAAREAGKLTLEYFRRDNLVVDRKEDDSPVTQADRGAEQLLRERISADFPEDAILGEELADRPGTSDYRWILDPIDGTKSFIHGVPLYGTLVGVEQRGEPVIGVIMIPVLDELLYAAKGQGAWLVVGEQEKRRARVSECDTLAEGLFLVSEVACFEEVDRRAAYDRLQTSARLARTWGDCYGYLMVATGRAELMIDPYMNIWDAAPLLTILEEAGGTFTDWQGQPTIHSGEGVATNGRVLAEVMGLLGE